MKNTRYFSLDSNTILNYSSWIKKAICSNQPIPFPTDITKKYKLKFLKSTSYEQQFLNNDSTHSNTLRVDSLNIDNTLNIKSKIISIQKREKIDSIPGAYYDLYKTDYTFRETISKSSYSIPFHLIEHRLNPVNLDTIFKRTITSSPWKEGKKYRITVEGTIPEDLYYNQQINENTITKREVDLFCNSNNKIIAFEIANITIKGDTFKLSEALHNSGVWQNKGCFKNGEHYYTHGAEYERLTPYNKTYIMPMTRNYYNGSPWLKKESKIEKYDYTKKELRK